MHKLVKTGFYVTLLLFLVMGAVLVLAQLGGVAGFQPQLVVDLKEILGPPTFMMSTLCALLAFALSYSRNIRKYDLGRAAQTPSTDSATPASTEEDRQDKK